MLIVVVICFMFLRCFGVLGFLMLGCFLWFENELCVESILFVCGCIFLIKFFLLWYLVNDIWMILFKFRNLYSLVKYICIAGFVGCLVGLLLEINIKFFFSFLVSGFLKKILRDGWIIRKKISFI